MSKKFITGVDLFGMGIGAYDLLTFISGGAVAGPITAAGSQRTKETDPCLFCGPVNPSWGGKLPCLHAKSFICESVTEADLQSRLSTALFPEQSLQQLREVMGVDEPEPAQQEATIKLEISERPREHAEVAKPMGTRERRTHQVIIAALCQKNKIDPKSRDAVARLVSLTQETGAGVGEDTIRKILKEIPESIELRMK